jgi:hypothetical protein
MRCPLFMIAYGRYAALSRKVTRMGMPFFDSRNIFADGCGAKSGSPRSGQPGQRWRA